MIEVPRHDQDHFLNECVLVFEVTPLNVPRSHDPQRPTANRQLLPPLGAPDMKQDIAPKPPPAV